MSDFGDRVVGWFDQHGRKDLPWQVQDAYRVWVSEIMLQQTQVQTVIPYFEAFMRRFPSVVLLADAHVDDVLQHWSGLGYYARARNLHKAAQHIRDKHDGRFPDDRGSVEALPGIGRSTAGAILSLAFGQRHAILDGNVKRVLARHAAIEGWPGKTAVANRLWELAEERTPLKRVSDYTQAIMDLGATLCTRHNPACGLCPVHADCMANALLAVHEYPGRKPKKDKPRRETTMLLALFDRAVFLERRPPSGIWGGLWSFPELTDDSVENWCERVAGGELEGREDWGVLRHSFSHYDLDIRPVVLRFTAVRGGVADDDGKVWYRPGERPPGGLAAPVQKLIETLRDTHHVADS